MTRSSETLCSNFSLLLRDYAPVIGKIRMTHLTLLPRAFQRVGQLNEGGRAINVPGGALTIQNLIRLD